jgi:hypothetical protein
VTDVPGATVIFLQSHPAWIAARRREQERRAAIRRHPSSMAHRNAASGGKVAPVTRDFKLYSSSDTPA